MTAPAEAPVPLCRVLAHPRVRGIVSERVAFAESLLVAHARQLADALGLDDVPGLLGGASGLAASEPWEREARR